MYWPNKRERTKKTWAGLQHPHDQALAMCCSLTSWPVGSTFSVVRTLPKEKPCFCWRWQRICSHVVPCCVLLQKALPVAMLRLETEISCSRSEPVDLKQRFGQLAALILWSKMYANLVWFFYGLIHVSSWHFIWFTVSSCLQHWEMNKRKPHVRIIVWIIG